jgi:hypothetical protein
MPEATGTPVRALRRFIRVSQPELVPGFSGEHAVLN